MTSNPSAPTPADEPRRGALREVADRVWVVRHPWLDVNVTVVGSAAGLVVVDSLGSAAAARALVETLRPLAGASGVHTVLNTHWHFDHTFGNDELLHTWPDAVLVAHEAAAAELARDGEAMRRTLSEPGHPDSDGHHDDVAATILRVPTETFSSARVLDLGDRVVEVLHLGAGHTAGDAVVHVPDADLLVAGDLVEESGPPCYGDDSHPLAWPGTVDSLLGLLRPGTVVVPGHGDVVDRAFVEAQADDVHRVADTVRGLASSGVSVDDALDAAQWPWPREHLVEAVRRGYAHLPATAFGPARRLPLA
ncbi:MBL fold metallo-hydrolase [Nocardioides yefusunii]|uniref:MBL fold metallo-hydrolase n=1 Tax=Nocardioides yefusunii TaxID=2500546 RepID=A0ABW1QYV9_9ACTN|nr:MBL fold metallo-hydrolase [Nocardioides yefusunii]